MLYLIIETHAKMRDGISFLYQTVKVVVPATLTTGGDDGEERTVRFVRRDRATEGRTWMEGTKRRTMTAPSPRSRLRLKGRSRAVLEEEQSVDNIDANQRDRERKKIFVL